MRIIRRLFLFVCIFATCLIVWGAVYARKQGFTNSWRDAIEREFSKRGYYVDIGKLTLGAFRGLVAEDVRLFQDVERSQEIAFLDDVYLDVDLSKILNKQIDVKTLDVQDASLSLPLEPGKADGERLTVTGLSGRVVITESVIEVLKAEAEIAGWDVFLKGSLLRDMVDQEEVKDEDGDEDGSIAERQKQILQVLKELGKFEYEDQRPELDLEFRTEISDLSSATASLRVKTGEVRKRGETYKIEALEAKIEYDGLKKSAEIEELALEDTKGTMALDGVWENASNRLVFRMDSTADLAGLAGWFVEDKALGEIVFFTPPTIAASGFVDFGMKREGDTFQFPGEVIGDFRTGRFVTRGTVFAGLDFGFSLSGEKIYLRDLRLDHKTGVAFLNLKYEPGSEDETLRYQTEIKLDPLVFRPFFDERGRKFIDAWNFGEESTVYIAAVGQGSAWNPSSWANKGVIDLRHFRLNGVDFEEMEADFESDGSLQWFRDVKLIRNEGSITAELAHCDTKTKQWEVKGVVSTVDHVEGARAFSPKLAKAMNSYRYSSPPTVRLHGMLDARRAEEVGNAPRKNKISLTVSGGGTASYDFLGKALQLSNPIGAISIDGSRVHVTEMTGGLFGGSIRLEYDSKNVRSSSKPFDATIQISDMPLEAITKHFNDTDSVKGTLDTTFSLTGNAPSPSSFNGSGSGTISNGNIFAVPVLGPLTRVIAGRNNSRGEGNNIVREASASFRITNGVLRTDDLEALAKGLRIRSAGTVSLVDKSVDLEAVVNTRDNLSSTILTPVSELLTYSCSGTISEPVWKPKHISGIAQVPAQVISEMTNIPIEGLKKIGKFGQEIFGQQKKRTPPGSASSEEDRNTAPLKNQPFKKLFQRAKSEE